MRFHFIFSFFFLYFVTGSFGQEYTHADTLRGSNGIGRAWYDVLHYDLSVRPNIVSQELKGQVVMTFKVVDSTRMMQIDLQGGLSIQRVLFKNQNLSFRRENNVYWVIMPSGLRIGHTYDICFFYSGKPIISENPPWSGGMIWEKDPQNRPFIAVACQGIGASVWWPCKDYNCDEPDLGVTVQIEAPASLKAISNGQLISVTKVKPGIKKWRWEVKSSINLYSVTMNIGNYNLVSKNYQGLNGKLNLSMYALPENKVKALNLLEEAAQMMACFESKLGPYPFYKDGYKIVEVPFLGMEHQSNIAYGNDYLKGYKGSDRSRTGVGLKWDFILVHESAHEWFGNSISACDPADEWIHESLTTYAETIYSECLLGKDKAFEYIRGQRHYIQNHRPLVGDYGVNQDPTGDIYEKGANVIHTLRQWINNDQVFFDLMKAISSHFYHQEITSKMLESFIIDQLHFDVDLQPFFNQYLRTPSIPKLEYKIENGVLLYRWNQVVNGFVMPVDAIINKNLNKRILITEQWQQLDQKITSIEWNPNVYCTLVNLNR